MDVEQSKPVQYTIPNYHLDNVYEWVQYVNRMIAHLICIDVHITIICKLLYANKFRVKSDYQILIIVQSAINIIASLSELCLNEIQTLNRWYLKVGHPWWHFSKTEKLIITILWTVFSNSTQDFLALFNLHRYIMIRGKSLKALYCIAIPIMVLSTVGDVYTAWPTIQKDQDTDLFFKYSQIPFLSVIIIFCYWKLNKEFKTNTSYSEKTKRLQEKLSLSILLQIFMLGVIAVMISLIPSIFETFFDSETYHQFDVQYTIIALCITHWYPLFSASLIAWSITGFFKSHPSTGSNGHSDMKIVQVEPSPTAELPRRTSKTHKMSVI